MKEPSTMAGRDNMQSKIYKISNKEVMHLVWIHHFNGDYSNMAKNKKGGLQNIATASFLKGNKSFNIGKCVLNLHFNFKKICYHAHVLCNVEIILPQ